MILKALRFTLVLFFLVSLSGCLGNAEGYGNRPKDDTGGIPSGGAQGLQYYFQVDPHYTCKKDGEIIPSHRDALVLVQSKAFLLGDLCQPKTVEVSPRLFRYTKDRMYLTFQNRIFSWLPAVITAQNISSFPSVEALCFDSAEGESKLQDLVIERTPAPENEIKAHGFLETAFVFPQALARANGPQSVTYFEGDFELVIQTTGVEATGTGQIRLKWESENIDQKVDCTLSPFSFPAP